MFFQCLRGNRVAKINGPCCVFAFNVNKPLIFNFTYALILHIQNEHMWFFPFIIEHCHSRKTEMTSLLIESSIYEAV
jgi:hypothetical protein